MDELKMQCKSKVEQKLALTGPYLRLFMDWPDYAFSPDWFIIGAFSC